METIDFNEVIRDNIEVVGELLPMATLTGNGLMSFEDKRKMFKPMPTSGGGLTHIAKIDQFKRYGAVIYVMPNNERSQGLFILKAGNSKTINPSLVRLCGDKINGKIYYKITGSTMDIYYKSSNSDSGPQDIFQTIIGTPTYTAYEGSIEDMTELAVS